MSSPMISSIPVKYNRTIRLYIKIHFYLHGQPMTQTNFTPWQRKHSLSLSSASSFRLTNFRQKVRFSARGPGKVTSPTKVKNQFNPMHLSAIVFFGKITM
jgi:hypothetical protein